ncbi:MAG: amidohydrolase, partial [Chloroflexi bacterium]|nr:amidohydrolase [Chloroflexota bacterium]
MNAEETVLRYLDAHEDRLAELSRVIWERPELGGLERFASGLLVDELKSAGFFVDMGVGQMPTAFVASWGEGKPIIGILGEYDALPGLSQKVAPTREPIEDGAPGHGCGHNLLGVGALGAALAAKEAMEKANLKGTIRFYGCPAEESLSGKVYMARDGVFDDLDAALSWHPADVNNVSNLLT